MKKVLLGMLLVGSVAFGAKAIDYEPKCLGLDGDFEQLDEHILQLKRAANTEAILNDKGKVVEILDYAHLGRALIIHIVREHEDYLSLELLNDLSDTNDRLKKVIEVGSK